ncbi:MAG: ammonia-forming cytochrome c nitrite reductase subunit c552 [Planctomycetaceae bacterium]
MTQEASDESVVPSFNDIHLTSRGREYHLHRQGDEFWVDTVDPGAEMRAYINGQSDSSVNLPSVHRQIVMTTGSHLHQTYWMQNPNGTLVQFPWVYHIDSQRWVYRIDSFLSPPRDTVTFNIWNMKCIGCHATGGEPRMSGPTRSMHSVGELGISCEACHGPGSEHVELAKNKSTDVKSAVAHPGTMDPVESAKVCGQCHVISRQKNEPYFLTHGDPYRPGNDKFDTLREVVLFGEDRQVQQDHFPTMVKTGFWPDGTVRTGGREYNALLLSACYTRGRGVSKMTCTSCHSMHQYESTNKLITRGKTGNASCIQCHTEAKYTADIQQHTHHAPASAGSNCLNCHMPHTSYALFGAIRSHRVQSPRIPNSGPGVRPNACNLCHLDQTQQWAAEMLNQWYELKPPNLTIQDQTVSAGATWATTGDAAQRAIAAWHLGWPEARSVSATYWKIPLLADLLLDQYSAVRYLAFESLQKLLGDQCPQYDFDGPLPHRESVRQEVLSLWKTMSNDGQTELMRQTLLNGDGTRNQQLVDSLLEQQDQTPIAIVE